MDGWRASEVCEVIDSNELDKATRAMAFALLCSAFCLGAVIGAVLMVVL